MQKLLLNLFRYSLALLVFCNTGCFLDLGVEDPPSLIQMIENLEHGSQQQKLEAARLLSSKGSIAVWPLQKALRDPDFAVRGAAAYSLGKIGPPAKEAIPDLTEALNDDYSYVSDLAREALVKITRGTSYR